VRAVTLIFTDKHIYTCIYVFVPHTLGAVVAAPAPVSARACRGNSKEGGGAGGAGGGGGGLRSPQRQLLYECAASAQAGSPWLKTTPFSVQGEPQTFFKHICVCVLTLLFTHIYLWVRVHVHTHMYVLEWICFHTRIHTRTVSDVTHKRHMIALDPSPEKREVDSLHDETMVNAFVEFRISCSRVCYYSLGLPCHSLPLRLFVLSIFSVDIFKVENKELELELD